MTSNPTHGMSNTPEHDAWKGAKQRCFNPNRKGFSEYGGRGITMCAEWAASFVAFYEHIGPRPGPDYSLDRIDVNGHYEPGNVRWATAREQMLNRRPVSICRRKLHPMTDDNIVIEGSRRCKACREMTKRERWESPWSVSPLAVRLWARQHGFEVSRRGRMPRRVIDAWNSAHPDEPFYDTRTDAA